MTSYFLLNINLTTKCYVFGYTGYDDKIKPLKESQTQNEENHVSCHFELPQNTSTYKMCNCISCKCCFPSKCSLKIIVYSTLYTVRYLSQLATVPLLFLQIFDMYSFLCFSPEIYCTHITENKLHLLQTTITLLFYCSLGGAHLAGTMMLWNLWWPEVSQQEITEGQPMNTSMNNSTVQQSEETDSNDSEKCKDNDRQPKSTDETKDIDDYDDKNLSTTSGN